ncbi:MAG: MotA/TolQ/ExbB proton channel family protein [Candidatus Schekmanbacteria bacterium]|nr:MotA/TolQ/ExbB proton channel family protein [Candidatus Schekmanbacteria bacterium]
MQFSFLEMWTSMGLIAKTVVFILAGSSIYAFTIIAERWWTFYQAKKQTKTFIAQSASSFKSGKLKEVLPMAEEASKSHVARVVAAGLKELKLNEGGSSNLQQILTSEDKIEAASRAIQRETAVEVARLKKGTGGLATVGSISPFVGLFGTIFGIINSFQAMATSGSGGLATVSAGIAEALVTTALGIGVAIPAVVFFNFFITKTENYVVEIDNSSSELVDYLLKEATK